MAATTKKRKPTAFNKPVSISEELEKVVGKGPMPRTKVTKKLWDYIKKHDLQDPDERRKICPDDNLAKIFGSKRKIDMFKMTALVSKHID